MTAADRRLILDVPLNGTTAPLKVDQSEMYPSLTSFVASPLLLPLQVLLDVQLPSHVRLEIQRCIKDTTLILQRNQQLESLWKLDCLQVRQRLQTSFDAVERSLEYSSC